MPRHVEGQLTGSNDKFAVVVSRFNDTVTRRLLSGALETFRGHGVADEQVTVYWVPGSFEIPLVAERLAFSGQVAAVCCLGAVIRGETMHHEYINQQVAAGLMRTSQASGVPVLFGVLTCDTLEQALDRADGKAGNKGSETALAALEMVSLLRQLPEEGA